jgi:hypothetical protein
MAAIGPAADDTTTTVTGRPGRTICWRALVTFVPAILNPGCRGLERDPPDWAGTNPQAGFAFGIRPSRHRRN